MIAISSEAWVTFPVEGRIYDSGGAGIQDDVMDHVLMTLLYNGFKLKTDPLDTLFHF